MNIEAIIIMFGQILFGQYLRGRGVLNVNMSHVTYRVTFKTEKLYDLFKSPY